MSGAQTFTTRRVSFPENMMFNPWFYILYKTTVFTSFIAVIHHAMHKV